MSDVLKKEIADHIFQIQRTWSNVSITQKTLQSKMVGTVAGESVTGDSIDRLQQVKVFDESKAGIKGLFDSGVTRIPPIFVTPPERYLRQWDQFGQTNPNPVPNSGCWPWRYLYQPSRCRGQSPTGCRDDGAFPGGEPWNTFESIGDDVRRAAKVPRAAEGG